MSHVRFWYIKPEIEMSKVQPKGIPGIGALPRGRKFSSETENAFVTCGLMVCYKNVALHWSGIFTMYTFR